MSYIDLLNEYILVKALSAISTPFSESLLLSSGLGVLLDNSSSEPPLSKTSSADFMDSLEYGGCTSFPRSSSPPLNSSSAFRRMYTVPVSFFRRAHRPIRCTSESPDANSVIKSGVLMLIPASITCVEITTPDSVFNLLIASPRLLRLSSFVKRE